MVPVKGARGPWLQKKKITETTTKALGDGGFFNRTMDEIWKTIKGYEGLYEVSNWGRVRSLGMWVNGVYGCKRWFRGGVLRPAKNRDGYLRVALYKDGVVKHWSVHRLVGMAFPDLVDWTEDAKDKPFDELEINHKDHNKENNRVENLEWCDGPYNVRYSFSKKVYMYTMDGKLCGLWPSTNECGRHGFNQSHIAKCCNGKKYKKHRGFKWSYEPPKPPKALPYFGGCM